LASILAWLVWTRSMIIITRSIMFQLNRVPFQNQICNKYVYVEGELSKIQQLHQMEGKKEEERDASSIERPSGSGLSSENHVQGREKHEC
jgi:hypothetical protein